MQSAINRKTLYEKYFYEHLPVNGIIPKGLAGGGLNNYVLDYSPEELKRAMNKFHNTTNVEFWIRNQDWNQSFAQDIVSSLANVGIKVRVVNRDDDVFYDKYFSRKQQMFFITIGASYKDASDILSSFNSKSNDNDVGINDKNIDKELQLLSLEVENDKRADKMRNIEKMILNHAAIIPIYQRVSSTIYQKYIDNVSLTPSWHEDIHINDYVKYESK